VIVDNGSNDGSQKTFRVQLPDVVLLEQKENHGCAGGRNIGAGFALAEGADYILFLDNDTIVAVDFLDRLIEKAESYPQIGALGPQIRYYDEPQRIWTAGAQINWRNGHTYPLYHKAWAQDVPADDYEVDFVAGCALLARRAIFEHIGLFDEDYFIYFEETDWCLRVLKAGYHNMVIPTSIIWHKESLSLGGASSPPKVYYLVRNQLLFLWKRFPKYIAIPALFSTFMHELLTIFIQTIRPRYRSIKEQRNARFRALADFFSGKYGRQILKQS